MGRLTADELYRRLRILALRWHNDRGDSFESSVKMLSRSILRSSLRALPRTIARSRPRTPFPRFFQQSKPLNTLRFASGGPRPPRIIHYKYNPEEIQRAKPLVSEEQIRNGFRHPGTKLLFLALGSGGIIFYVSNLETVPVSGRRRFNCYSEESVEAEGQMLYKMIMQDNRQAILPEWDPRTRMVERVMRKLIPASGLEDVNVGLSRSMLEVIVADIGEI